MLQQIKSIALQFDESKNAILSLLNAQQSFLSCKQLPGQSADDYADCLIGWPTPLKPMVGLWRKITNWSLNDRSVQERKSIARKRTFAMAFIHSSDASKYRTLITDLSNQYAMGRDEYPTDMVSAKSLFVMYKTPANAPAARAASTRSHQPLPSHEASALTFAQRSAALVTRTNGLTHEGIQCWNCQQHGHNAGECPSTAATSGTTLTQYAFVLAQSSAPCNHSIDPDWILLDSQSTILFFVTPVC